MDQAEGETPWVGTDAEMKELLGLYDVPAFARRGQDLEYALARLDVRCRRERAAMLEMVRVRLRQWATVASGPATALDVFTAPIDGLWSACDAPPPIWAGHAAPRRRLRAAARDLVASVARFNRRWTHFLAEANFPGVNRLIDQYNCYYVLEKECALGSSRLASRFFTPRPKLSQTSLLETYPTLATPELKP